MEYKSKKIGFTYLLYSFLKKKLSSKESLDLLHKTKNEQEDLSDFVIYQDTQTYLPKSVIFNRFIINANIGDKKIESSSASDNLTHSLISAYGEFFERLTLTKSAGMEKSKWSFKKGKWSTHTDDLNSSNGIAFHSNLYLAIQNGFYELIERHCLLKSWYSKASPVFKIDLSRNSFYQPFLKYCEEKNIKYHVLCLEKFNHIYSIAFILETKDNEAFEIVSSFSAHHDIDTAVKKSYFEVLRSLLVGPKKSYIEKNINTVEEMKDVLDHSIYYQNLEKKNCFSFWLNSNVKTIHLADLESTGDFSSFYKNLKCLKELDANIHFLNSIFLKGPWICLKISSKQLLEVHFCQDHDKIDKKLFENLTNSKGDFSEPHPLA